MTKLTLVNNWAMTKKFLITKFDCSMKWGTRIIRNPPMLRQLRLSPVPSFASLACFHLTRLFFVSIVDSTRRLCQYRRSLVHRASCPFGLRGCWAAGGYRLCAMRWRFSWLFLDSLQSEVTIFFAVKQNYQKLCKMYDFKLFDQFLFFGESKPYKS